MMKVGNLLVLCALFKGVAAFVAKPALKTPRLSSALKISPGYEYGGYDQYSTGFSTGATHYVDGGSAPIIRDRGGYRDGYGDYGYGRRGRMNNRWDYGYGDGYYNDRYSRRYNRMRPQYSNYYDDGYRTNRYRRYDDYNYRRPQYTNSWWARHNDYDGYGRRGYGRRYNDYGNRWDNYGGDGMRPRYASYGGRYNRRYNDYGGYNRRYNDYGRYNGRYNDYYGRYNDYYPSELWSKNGGNSLYLV